MEIIKKHISKNYSIGRVINPEYIVIHNTDNEDKGANAEAHFNYWNTNNNANSSVHFVVDDSKCIQLLELNERAWHVGDNKGYSNITNNNSIGIEICVNSDGDFNKAYNNAINLVRYLVKSTGIPFNKVVRHKDASGKYCPRKIMDLGLWEDFKSKIQGDSSKDSNVIKNSDWDDSVRGKIGTVTASELNVRYTADGEIIGTLKRGSKVRLWRLEGDWYHIYSPVAGYNQAYVHKNYISVDSPSPQATPSVPNKKYGIVTAKSGLNVRKGAGTNYPVVGVLKYRERVQLDVKVGKWWSTYYGDHGGFVSVDYIKEE